MAATLLGTPVGTYFSYVAGNTARTLSVTVASGSDRVMVIGACGYYDPGTIPASPVFSGITATAIPGGHISGGSPNFDFSSLWYVVAPTITTANITWTQPGESIALLWALVAQGVDQTTPYGDVDATTGTGTSASLTLTSTADELVVGAVAKAADTAATVGADQTSAASGSGGGESGRASYETGAASVVHSYTWTGSVTYAINAVALRAVAAATASLILSRGPRLSFALLAQ